MSEIKEICLKAFHEGYVFRMTLQADVSLRGFSVSFGPVQREREISEAAGFPVCKSFLLFHKNGREQKRDESASVEFRYRMGC